MTLIDVGYQTCVMCKEQVEVTSLMSSANADVYELDTRPKGLGRYSEKNYVHICPKCGYAGYNLEKDITGGNHDFLQTPEYLEVVNNKDINIDAKKFYLVGLILDQLNEYQRAASSYLRAAWFFYDSGDKEWANRSRKKTIDSLLESDFTWRNAQVCGILIDCYRRIGDFKSALKVISSFDFSNTKNSFYKKLFMYQAQLCEKEDVATHLSTEVEALEL